MAKTVEDLFREALTLSVEERAELVRLLTTPTDRAWASPEIEKAWLAEAERRHQAVLDGSEDLVPGDEVMRELHDIVSK